MPYDNVPEPLWGKMDSCVEQVTGEGKDKDAAIAICYASLVESEQPHAIEAALGEPSQSGHTWEVTAIAPKTPNDLVTVDGAEWILSPNGRAYSVNGLRDYAGFFEGAQVFDDHLTDREYQARQGMRSFLTDGVGILSDVSFNPERRAVCGTLHVVDDAAASKLLRMKEANVLKEIGLSIDVAPIPGKPITANGRRYETIVGFERVNSVDVVSKPATGGGFDRLIESEIPQEAIVMDEEQLKALIAKILEDMGIKPPEAPPMEAAKTEPAQESAPAVDAEIADKVRKLECKLMLSERLAASKLPEAYARIVESAFAGHVFSEGDLDTVIARAKEAQAARDTTGQPVGVGGGSGFASVMDPKDKALMGLLGATARTADKPLLHNLTGQPDHVTEAIQSWERAGRPNYDRTVAEWYRNMTVKGDPFYGSRAVESVGVAYILQDAVNVWAALDYSKKNEWWTPIVTIEEVDTIDNANLVTLFAASTLPVIAEGGAYTELQYTDKEETASYVKTGGYLGVTREDLLLDKTQPSKLRNLSGVLANSWYKAQSTRVAAVFTVNSATGPVMADSGALFNATAVGTGGGHANLLTTALSFTAFDAAVTAMMKQTDQALGAGEAMLLRPKFLLVPPALRATALNLRNDEFQPGTGNRDTNPYQNSFEVVVVPAWTDANNWAIVCDPAEAPMIYMIYPRGGRTPAVFVAGDETSGAVFTNDEIRYKVRSEFYRYSATYDCAPVADFRGLHKSNVA